MQKKSETDEVPYMKSLDTQKTLYLTYIRPALEYASTSWWPMISITKKDELQKVQNQCQSHGKIGEDMHN